MDQTSRQYIIIGVVLTTWVQVLVSMSMGTLAVLAPPLMDTLGVPTHYIGIIVAALYGTAAVTSAVSGAFVTRYGAIRTSQFCMLATLVGLGIAAMAQSLAMLFIGAVVLGFAFGPSTPASSHLLSSVATPRFYNLIFSVKQTGVPIGNAIAGAAMPALALAAGVPFAMMTQAVAALATGLLLEFYRSDYDRDLAALPKRSGLKHFSVPVMAVLRARKLRRLMISCLPFSFAQSASMAFFVAYLHEELGHDLVVAGVMSAILQVLGTIGRVAWGAIADMTGASVRVLAVLAGLMTLSMMLVAAIGPGWPLLIVAALAAFQGATAMSWNGIYIAETARQAPEGRISEVTGGVSFFIFMAVTMAPLAFSGIVGVTHSYAMAFALFGLGTLATTVALYLQGWKSGPAGREEGIS